VRYLIDPPSPFAPLADWQEFLIEVRRLADADVPDVAPEVVDAIREAEAAIANHQSGDLGTTPGSWTFP